MSETSELISLQSSCGASLALVCIKQNPPQVLQLTFITSGQTHLSGLISVCSEVIYSLPLPPNICWKCNGNQSFLQPKPSLGADVPSPVSSHCNACRPLLSSPTFSPLVGFLLPLVYGRIGNHLPHNGAQSHLTPHASTHPNLLSPTQTLFLRFRDRAIYVRGMLTRVKTGRCEAGVRSEWLTLLAPRRECCQSGAHQHTSTFVGLNQGKSSSCELSLTKSNHCQHCFRLCSAGAQY